MSAQGKAMVPSPASALVAESSQTLARHGRSFSWASRFLPRSARADAAITYAFCRLVDDVVDEAATEDKARAGIDRLTEELAGKATPRPLVRAWCEVESRHQIDPCVAADLVAGVRSDLGRVRVRDDEELLLYAYRVAGTVGLMMSRIVGATEPRAKRYAIDLGIAMQLTNICRDVTEDARLGRVYLPASRLRAVGVEPADLVAGRYDRAAVSRVVADLLALADGFYAAADAGMRWIPARPRLAIWIAARVYRAIGRRILRDQARALDERVYVSALGKLAWTARAAAAFLGLGRLRTRSDTLELEARRALPS
jgi:phytoene synthase